MGAPHGNWIQESVAIIALRKESNLFVVPKNSTGRIYKKTRNIKQVPYHLSTYYNAFDHFDTSQTMQF